MEGGPARVSMGSNRADWLCFAFHTSNFTLQAPPPIGFVCAAVFQPPTDYRLPTAGYRLPALFAMDRRKESAEFLCSGRHP
jgi:hypothetical protein